MKVLFTRTFLPLEQQEVEQEKQCSYNVTLRWLRVTNITVKSDMYHIFKFAFLALVIQHAKRMRHIVICGLSVSTALFHIISKRHDFRKKVIEYISILIFGTTFI
jgi:hypothetical protein